ncbi:MAG TPA: hypothetical protein VKQ30_20025 [Ktedonobacterales bacterium]|nr:hypothetical protein [Ktedonobacterales bacterium]
MGITNTLPGFPLVSQLHEPTMDRFPDENANWNCVAASLSAGLMYLLKRPFDGDEIKDAVYGQGYTGAQAAVRYVAYCASQGVALAPYNNASGCGLVAHIHNELLAIRPVVLTMPSQWGIPPPDPLHPAGSTHVGIAAGWGSGWLRIMNPWGGFWHDGDDAYWAARLCFGQVWSMAPIHSGGGPMVPNGWHDDGATLTAPNGKLVVHGFRDFVLNYPGGWDAANQPCAPELGGVTPANPVDPKGCGGSVQYFYNSLLVWQSCDDHIFLTYSGATAYLWLQQYQTSQTALDAANAQITQLQQQIIQLKSTGGGDPVGAQVKTDLKQWLNS